ncbi:MAG: hypothetical protein K9H64_12985 [Bacteroidales bacterium]|nr:hypothetical protein [Bacteroidales bacterium]MCF8456563.1 hypothetical protein [Bacteroidales bacterium]
MIRNKYQKNSSVVLIVLWIFLFPFQTIAQDYGYSWNDLVAWNGVTHWTNYLIMSPGYFGPNALPVPELRNGLVQRKAYFECLGEGHFSNGDNTLDLALRYYHPFANNRVAVEFYMVQVEYYKISAEVRNERKLRNTKPEGIVVGDLFFGTTIQLVKDRERFPDLTLEMFCKTTSGGGLDDARFTDHPAYYFNLNFGKDTRSPAFLDKIRWYTSLGFYNWQTNLDDYLQNDAPSYGLGFQMNKNSLEINNQLCGYLGYISWKDEPVVRGSEKPYIYGGDQPLVYRLILLKSFEKLNLKFQFQQGLHDFAYSSFSFGLQYMP